MFRNTIFGICAALIFGATLPNQSFAQGSQAGQQSSQDRYFNCQRQASEMSGYFGPTPSRQSKGGGALRGALRGAAVGTAVGVIGGKKVKRGKSAKRGAAIGFLFGAIAEGSRKSKEKQRRRDEEQRRVNYQMQLDNCMRYSGQ